MGQEQSTPSPLLQAYSQNALTRDVLHNILQQSPDELFIQNANGKTLLHLAAELGDIKLLTILNKEFQQMVQPNIFSSKMTYYRTPFQLALANKQEHSALYLWLQFLSIRQSVFYKDVLQKRLKIKLILQELLSTTTIDPFVDEDDTFLSNFDDLFHLNGIVIDYQTITHFMPFGMMYNIYNQFIPSNIHQSLLSQKLLSNSGQLPLPNISTLFQQAQTALQTTKCINDNLYTILCQAVATITYQNVVINNAKNTTKTPDNLQKRITSNDYFIRFPYQTGL